MFKKYSGAYVISLRENDDRRKNFIKDWNSRDRKIEIVEAIDTRLGWWKKYKDEISKESVEELKTAIKNKKRKTHACLTPGAIGCYLSHLNCWKKFLNSKKGNYCLILEDDSSLPKNLLPSMRKIVKNMQDKWGIILLGWIATEKHEPYNNFLHKVNKFALCHAYLLSTFGAKKLLKIHSKIEKQVDHFMSENSDKLKIYGTIKDICVQSNTCGYTNIQNFEV